MSTFGFNQYDALPGHKVGFKDGNLNLKNTASDSTTESILFMGTATDGPINQPVQVTPETAYAIFGKVAHDNGIANGATLLPAFEEAWQAGNRDIRLMRVTGNVAAASLTGTEYQKSQSVNTSQTFIAHGNDELTFVLKDGGLTEGSLVVRADGFEVQEANYTFEAGVAEDKQEGTPAVQAEIILHKDACDMEAEISVGYRFEYIDAEGITQSELVEETNVDASETPMFATGYSKEYVLNFVPKAGAKLYVNGADTLSAADFTVNAAAKTLTVHASARINLKDGLEFSYAYDEKEIVTPVISLESVYGGSLYNRTSAEVKKDEDGIVNIAITKPDSKKGIMSEQPLKFRSVDFANFQLLANAINTHPLNNVVRASVSNEFAAQLTDTLADKPKVFFSGGVDELNLLKEQTYTNLGGVKDSEGFIFEPGAYQILENYKVDYVVPLGVYADDRLVGKYDNFAYQLALACAVMSHYNSVTIGLINTSSPNTGGLRDVEDHVTRLEELENSYYMRDRTGAIIKDGEGNSIDLGQFIQVIAGPEPVVRNTRLGAVASNTPASYVGFVSQLPVHSAPTNKGMPKVGGLRFEYSSAQLNRLTKARFVTYRIKPNGQVGIVDAMTAAHAGSDYTRLSTARIVKEAVNQVREVADPFIGETNDTANRNALAAALDKRLGKMVESKALVDFEFQIIATPEMELIGEATIELTLRAPNELRNLTTIVGLQA